MPENKTREELVFLDFLPNWIKLGRVDEVSDMLRERFEETLSARIERYGKLTYLLLRAGIFNDFIRETRALYIDGHYRGAVALCGMTVEALCNSIAKERVGGELKHKLVDPRNDCRKKIEYLKNYFRITKTVMLLHRVLDIRNGYVHLHKVDVSSEEVLECVNLLHLAVIAEYGRVPAERGKVHLVNEDYINKLAKEFGLHLD